jgi:hypothetical protein
MPDSPNPSPIQEVERYGWVLGADGEHGGIDRRPDGGFVRYELEQAADQVRKEREHG